MNRNVFYSVTGQNAGHSSQRRGVIGLLRRDRAFAVIVALGVALRVFAWLVTWPTLALNDEHAYFGSAANWAVGGVFSVERPPVTQFLNAVTIRIFGPHVFAVRGASMLFGSLVVPLVYMVVIQVATRKSALIASGIAAVYPTLIGYSHYAFSESYFLAFFVVVILLSLRLLDDLDPWFAAATGLACGLAALTREVGVMLIAVIAFSLVWLRRRELRRALISAILVIVCAATVIAPWSIYMYRSTGMLTLVSQTTWMNIFLGNPPRGSQANIRSYARYRSFGKTDRQRSEKARKVALAAIWSRMPTWPLEKLTNLKGYFQPTCYTVRRLLSLPGQSGPGVGEWAYRFAWSPLNTQRARWTMAFATAASFVVIALLGAIGLVLAPARAGCFLLLTSVGLVLPALIAFPSTRFRLPVEVLCIVGTGFLLDDPARAWRDAATVRRCATVVAAAAMLWVIASRWDAFLSQRLF